jgi:hypothetical protein
MAFTWKGRIGMLLLLLLAVVFGITLLVNVSIPSVAIAIWLIIGAVLAIIGV